jgi:hypothetical protein
MPSLLFSPDQHAEAEQWLAAFTRRYHDSLTHRPVHPAIDRVALRALMSEPLPRVGQSLASLFGELEQVIVPNSTHTAHPRFLPYVQPSPNDLSPCADHVAALLNQNCNLWHLSPGANAVEGGAALVRGPVRTAGHRLRHHHQRRLDGQHDRAHGCARPRSR